MKFDIIFMSLQTRASDLTW